MIYLDKDTYSKEEVKALLNDAVIDLHKTSYADGQSNGKHEMIYILNKLVKLELDRKKLTYDKKTLNWFIENINSNR